MAEKKKNAKMANRNVGQDVINHDGDKYVVLRDGIRVYGGTGAGLGEAVLLATSLQEGAGIAQLGADGTWTQGTVGENGEFIAYQTA